MHLSVLKRDGRSEEVSFDKIMKRIRTLSEGLEHVNPDIVAQKVCSQLKDGMKTSELDEFAAETCAMMQARFHPNYGKLAARIVIDNHLKNTPKTMIECATLLHDAGVVSADHLRVASDPRIEEMIQHNRDSMFDYFGFKTLEKGYLLSVNGKVVERPQYMWMRVAIQLWGDDLKQVKKTYDALSEGFFIHATPTLFNSGTPRPQLSSCFLLQMSDDSIQGIYKTLGDCAQISKWAGGIGLHVHNVRSAGSRINGTNGKSTGIVPMLRVFNDTARYVNQGGKRNGSFAIYLEPWHADIEDFLRLKLNQGAEEERARDLFYGLWIPDLFMKRVEANADWTMFSPSEAPGLADCWGPEFEALYTKYETAGLGVKTMSAQKLWQMVLDAQIQTGTPYLCYKDAVNSKSNHKHLGTIKSSNLCTEIMEYTAPDETAVCNLGSLSLPKFVGYHPLYEKRYFDFEKLRHYTKILARNLDQVIDQNFYPTPECERSNKRHRPIGIGVQGLADVFAMLKYPWQSEQARTLNREIFENIYFAALESNIESSVAFGEYPTFLGSPASRNSLQYDMWNDPPRCTPYLNWTLIKDNVRKFGCRNSLMIAPMPTASTSQILGNNECFEPFTSNLYSRRVLAGEFMVVNKYLVEDLMSLGLWTTDVRTEIMANNGSIQSITAIPATLKEIYKTAWDIPMRTIIQMARDRAPFICQSQSLNLFVADPTYSKLSSMHFYAWREGLKTGCYYLRTKAASSAQKFTVEPPKEDCLTCSA